MTPHELTDRFAQDLEMARRAKSISRSNAQLMDDLHQYSLDPLNFKLNHSIAESWITMTYDIGLSTDILRPIKIAEAQAKVFEIKENSGVHILEQILAQLPSKKDDFEKSMEGLKQRETFVYVTDNEIKPVFEHLVWALDVLHSECMRLNNCYVELLKERREGNFS